MDEELCQSILTYLEGELPRPKVSGARRYFEDTKELMGSPGDFEGARFQDAAGASALSAAVLLPFLIPAGVVAKSLEGAGWLRRKSGVGGRLRSLRRLIADIEELTGDASEAGASPYRQTSGAGAALAAAPPEVAFLATEAELVLSLRYKAEALVPWRAHWAQEGLLLAGTREGELVPVVHLFLENRRERVDELSSALRGSLLRLLPRELVVEDWFWMLGEPDSLERRPGVGEGTG